MKAKNNMRAGFAEATHNNSAGRALFCIGCIVLFHPARIMTPSILDTLPGVHVPNDLLQRPSGDTQTLVVLGTSSVRDEWGRNICIAALSQVEIADREPSAGDKSS